MAIQLLLGFAFLQTASIGSALSDRIQLVYESDGLEQAPWVYDSVRVVQRDDFERCVVVARVSQAARESCVRGDTLFDRDEAGAYVAVRPIGSNMQLAVPTASGNVLHYTTGDATIRRVGRSLEFSALSTTVETRDTAGTLIRRLREEYAPALLTAVWGVFEQPDLAGGWSRAREFSLVDVRYPEAEAVRPPAAAGEM